MGRKRAFPWRWRIVALLLLVAMIGAGWAWWQAQHWRPARAQFATQGVLVGAGDGAMDFTTLAAIGADFVYVEASSGERGRDPRLGTNLRALVGGDLPFGVVHSYDPCVAADRQAANFVTIVPRDATMLPPVIALDKLASECGDPIIEAGVESELTTFLNQIEAHTGQPAILKLSPEFEEHYDIARRMERGLWLDRDFIQPDYAGRPWTLWTATTHLRGEGSDGPLRWVVVQP